ncbi:hypothetical protein BCF44_106440 [Kutzneria buriramensis]|uniref:Uncharacterized protein n=1 Tax=Kutzneria buriramensis TaxID=1045776 RepID=A0A3E0HMP0_9PSEU|nr:hypothetical protein BCF44_106440 [Kutzneria buriramensis]
MSRTGTRPHLASDGANAPSRSMTAADVAGRSAANAVNRPASTRTPEPGSTMSASPAGASPLPVWAAGSVSTAITRRADTMA